MAHMLAMTALELGYPVVLVVLVKTGNTAFHRIACVCARVRATAIKPGTTLRNRIRP